MLRTNLIAVYLLVASPALAVQTSHWTASGETDFKKGTMHNVVATNLGDLKLSRDVKTLIEENPLVSAVYAMVEAGDGTIYAATGPHGVLLRIKDGKAQTVATFEDKSSLFALLLDPDGSLIVGVSGDKGKVYRIEHPAADNATPAEIFSDDDAQYIWGLQRTADGNLYIATGPNGKLFELKADGAKSVLLASDESNLLSLLSDGKDLLYVGTDPNGLVYRINRKTRDVFILFDAPESEIGCLAMDKKGNLYAGTAEAQENPPGTKAENGESGKAGRPEGNGAVPLPSTPPQLPNPPAKPEPNPGEPNPIPKKTIFRHRLNGQHSSAIFAVFDNPAIPTPGDKPKPGPATAPANPAAPLTPATENPPVPRPQGNAIYRIDLDGFVTEIFRQPVMVLSMLEHNGVLLVGTGSDGLIYQVDPAAEETVVLAKVDPKQVLSILAAKDGRIVLGLANVGGIAAMSSGFAAEGTFTSPVLDATQISRFGKMHLEGSLPQASKLTVATRSGNVQDPGKAGWSAWSDDVPATEYVQTSSPSARFLQYRLTLASNDAKATPVVNLVDVAYQTPNVAPLIHSIRVGNNPPKASSSPPAIAPNSADDSNAQAPAPSTPPTLPNAEANRVQPITWEADDANGDSLVYSLYFHRAGISPWILLKDKLTESHFDWDTRTVADGRYEVKVVASDAPSNPPGQGKTASRVSDPLVIDNTPPVIYDVNQTAQGEHVTINAKAADATSIVSSIEYSLDSATDWQLVLPSNKMYDSPEEAVEFALPGLSSGAHQVTLRATDSKGNQAYHTVLITVAAAKK